MAKLKEFELTWVVYDPADSFGIILALVTLSPIFIMVMYTTLIGFQRDLDIIAMLTGQLLSEAANQILKRTIKQNRPDGAHKSGAGMPSAHAQFMGFFAAYVIAYTYKRLNAHRKLEQLFVMVGVAFLAVLVWISRVRLGYHTQEQVLVGAVVGIIFGLAWHQFVSMVSPWLFPLIMETNIAKILYLRDISHIPDLIVHQHQTCLSGSSHAKQQ